MSQTTRVFIFIVALLVLFFLNAVLLVYETKAGLRLSRWLTFVAPLVVLYFIVFKSGRNGNAPGTPTGRSSVPEVEREEDAESAILARELHDPEVEWQEIAEWPNNKTSSTEGDVTSTDVSPSDVSNSIEQLERLSKLRAEGHLTEDEYNTLKAKLLNA